MVLIVFEYRHLVIWTVAVVADVENRDQPSKGRNINIPEDRFGALFLHSLSSRLVAIGISCDGDFVKSYRWC